MSLFVLPPEILLQVYCSLSDFRSFGALRSSCRTLYELSKTNLRSIMSGIVHNRHPPEAFVLLDQYRPNGICSAQRDWASRYCRNSGFKLQGNWDLEYGSAIGVNEVDCLDRDSRAVRRQVELMVRMLAKGGDVVNADEVETMRRAVYNFVILLCQFHLSEVIECKDVEAAEEECDEGMLKNEDSELFEDFTYDYSYAASLSPKDLCAVIALEPYTDMVEGVLALVADESEDPEDAEDAAMDNEARLKRFALCNLIDCSKVSETFFEGSVKQVLADCLNKGLWRQSANSFKILEEWRKDPKIRLDGEFNSRLFKKKMCPVYCGDKEFRMKELLLLKKGGWMRRTNNVERKLFDFHHSISPWTYEGEFGDEYDEEGLEVVADWHDTVEDDGWGDDGSDFE
ncbi:hypothetical protein BJ508DRAFT_413448 [Ascobolus immersus RN42]|uniref:F-box domain-containing protein n=1 Tax=Ascobolus immersus RN42 TaxID=1160509 RepID=A0A3N4IDG0_ASCIM|nr:hypothetical protein BJ508DRAFT_413448 [Ascobolus immersus RN42]